MIKWGIKKIAAWSSLVIGAGVGIVSAATMLTFAAQPASDFSLQVSPSPLVDTVKPGEPKDLELKIRNNGTGTEELRIDPRKFTINDKSGEIKLSDKDLPDIAPWIGFSQPTFTVKPGESTTEKIHVALPADSGFSYSLALVISRANNQQSVKSGNTIKGSLAVFTLINADRPGAMRKVEVTDFKPTQSVYEYLPAEFNIAFRNTGNTIVQPFGSVFIQRGNDDKTPISTVPVNDKSGYLIPGSPRTLKTDWNSGFPVIKTVTGADGQQKQEVSWDWSKLADFRIGQYTAKLVAVYNDGQRDIPIERTVTFWVFPWKIILGLIVVLGVLGVGIWTIAHKTSSVARRRGRRTPKSEE